MRVGVANTGFLPTNVTAQAVKNNAVLPTSVEIAPDNPDTDSFTPLDATAPLRVTVGQLAGRLSSRVEW